MLEFFGRWYRNRAIGGALLLFPVLIYLSYSMYNYRNNKVVEKTPILAVVKEMEFRGKEEFRHFKVTLTLPDGKTTVVNFKPKPAPKPGEKIPLTMWTRKFGDIEYHLDREKWERERPIE